MSPQINFTVKINPQTNSKMVRRKSRSNTDNRDQLILISRSFRIEILVFLFFFLDSS